MTTRPTLEEVKARLAAQALPLALQLAPGGTLKGANYWARNPQRIDGGNLTSFSVNVRRAIWKDFSLGDGGDMFKFVAVFACGGDYKRAWTWSLDFLGLTGKAPDPAETATIIARADAQAQAEADKLAKMRRYAMRLWLEAKPLDGHDPASEYLAHRGIDVHALNEIPRALRFHPKIWPPTGGGPHPAMVAAIAREGLPKGQLASVHCTYLAWRDGRMRKALRTDERSAKEVLCAYAGGSIRLSNGDSGRRLAEARDGETAMIGEGIENVLSAALSYPAHRAIAGVSLANIASLALPPALKNIILLADNDAPGKPAAIAFEKVEQALVDRGLHVTIARVDPRFKDFNDALTGQERAA